MKFEQPMSNGAEAKAEAEQKKLEKPLKRISRFSHFFGGAMSLLAATQNALAQETPRVDVYDITEPTQEVPLDELRRIMDSELAMFRSNEALEEEGPGMTNVYEASSLVHLGRRGAVRATPEVVTSYGSADALRALEGHTIEVSSFGGELTRTIDQSSSLISETYLSQRMRVLDIDSSIQVEPTGRVRTVTGQASTLEIALAVAFEHLSEGVGQLGRERHTYVAEAGETQERLHTNSQIHNGIAINVDITAITQLPNGEFQVSISADEGRIVEE
mgnify:FL=1